MKIIMFNGPPKSGKDTAGHIVNAWISLTDRYNPIIAKTADPLKAAVHAAFGLSCKNDHFEMSKDKPATTFMGKTPREVYIALSEDFMKPTFGQEIWAKSFAMRFQELKNRMDPEAVVICTDCGFNPEVEAAAELVGRDNVLIVKLERDGYTFDNDSRGYVDTPGIARAHIHNEQSMAMFEAAVLKAVESWLFEDENGKAATSA